MAVIKAVSSHAPIDTAIDYVTEEEKTEKKLISGLHVAPESAKDQMEVTKLMWGKTDGRTYKHFVQSFAPEEDITPDQAHQIARKFAAQCPLFKGFEVLLATHQDKDHVHTHFIVNSVSFEDGHKIQQSKADLQDMKELSDKICLAHGLSITRKGKTFEGEEREETTAYTKEQYQLMKKADNGEVNSYIQKIALEIMRWREEAENREDFIAKMRESGIDVNWSDSRKYITFTDLERQEQGEKKCKVRNNKLEQYFNVDFSKEELEHEFEENSRRTKARKVVATERSNGKNRAYNGNRNYSRTEEDGIRERSAKASISYIERELRGTSEAVKSRTSQGREEKRAADEQAKRDREELAKRQRTVSRDYGPSLG